VQKNGGGGGGWRGRGKLEGGGRWSANCENLIRVGKVTPRGNQEREELAFNLDLCECT
jgi:hypothetical protein